MAVLADKANVLYKKYKIRIWNCAQTICKKIVCAFFIKNKISFGDNVYLFNKISRI